jgi:hypothetical protein
MTKTAILSLAALLLALAANPLFAQSVPVTGHVTDDTGYPLPGAVV